MISREEVSRIAKLARIDLSEKEYKKMQKDLSEILDYFELLKKQKAGAKKKENYSQPNKLRKDEPVAKDSGLADSILEAAPNRKERYIKVKSILS